MFPTLTKVVLLAPTEVPVPTVAEPAVAGILAPAKVIVAPLQTALGLAVADVIFGKALTVTTTLLIAEQAPSIAFTVYVYEPTAVGVMVIGLPVIAEVAALPAVDNHE